MAHRDDIECWLTDMDGVLVHENDAIPGASEMLAGWEANDIPYLVLTNNSIFTARDLSARLRSSGLDVPEKLDLDLSAGHRRIPAAASARRLGVRHR